MLCVILGLFWEPVGKICEIGSAMDIHIYIYIYSRKSEQEWDVRSNKTCHPEEEKNIEKPSKESING